MIGGKSQTKVALLAFVVVGKGLEDLISLKIRFLQRGHATILDLRVLDDIHKRVLRRLEKLSARGRAVMEKINESALGVDDSEVRVAKHDPAWPKMFHREADLLERQLGSRVVAIHHVGSTAVPGLVAKPIIDIALEIGQTGFDDDLNVCEDALAKLGYRYLGDRGPKGGRMFGKDQSGKRTHAIQVHPKGSASLRGLLQFRQMLLNDSDLTREYAEIKTGLAELFRDQRLIYVWYKTHWIEDLFLDKTDANAWGRWLVSARIPTLINILVRAVHRRISSLNPAKVAESKSARDTDR